MQPNPRVFTTRFRVRYAETDQMGVVYHANYLVWFEVGRVEMLRELGFAYRQMESEHDCVLPVVEVNCRYRSPARYDDQLVLETRLVALRGPLVKFRYTLHRWEPPLVTGGLNLGSEFGSAIDSEAGSGPDRGQNLLLAEAISTHIVVDRSLKQRALPEKYASALRSVLWRPA